MKKKELVISFICIILLIVVFIGIIYKKDNNKYLKDLTINKSIIKQNLNNDAPEEEIDSKENLDNNKDPEKNDEKHPTIKPENKPNKVKPTEKENNNSTSNDKNQSENNKPTSPEKDPNSSVNNSKPSNKDENNEKPKPNNNPTQNNNTSDEKENNNTTITPEVKPPSNELDSLKSQIQNNYGINIKIGNETSGYYPVGTYSTTPLTDTNEIKTYLNTINYELSKYPVGFFREMSSFGMPLTIYLVASISSGAAGVTDRQFSSDIKITYARSYDFAGTLHHELMHYIDAYIDIKSGYATYNEYTALNPADFSYMNFNPAYNYGYNGQVKGAYFLNEYSQYSPQEDRAELFKYGMTMLWAKVGLFDQGEVLRQKIDIIERQIRTYFTTASGPWYWNKYIR